MLAEIGYRPADENDDDDAWVWFDAAPNESYVGRNNETSDHNNDEYMCWAYWRDF